MSAARPPASRNDPCPCGSGLRYKHCHGRVGAAPEPDAPARGEGPRPAPAPAATPRAGPVPAVPGAVPLPAVAALIAQANAAFVGGRLDEAEAACRKARELEPRNVAVLNLLGEILVARDPDGALAAWSEARAVAPDNPETRFHLGNLHRTRGEPLAAVEEYRHALRAAPDHTGLLNNLGLALGEAGEREEAVACYRRAIALDPGHAEALGNLAGALYDAQDFAGAAPLYDRLFALRPALDAGVWARRAVAHDKLEHNEVAERCYVEALARTPDEPRLLANLATVRVRLERYAEAEEPLRHALRLSPGNPHLLATLASVRQQQCAWDGIEELFAALERAMEAGVAPGENVPEAFGMLAMPLSPRAHLEAAKWFADRLRPDPPPPRPPVTQRPGERLRVGFVSANFREHPTAYLMMEVWERMDRGRIESFAYDLMPDRLGHVGPRIRRAFEHYADVSTEEPAAVARRIREDRISVLVDRNGYTRHSRPAIFALRPAPLQVNSIGFPGTMGAEWYDYIHVCPFAAPPESQRWFTERFLHFRHAHFPSDTTRAPKGPPPPRAALGLPERGFVFCCFNNAYKILPPVFAVWMRLLAAVPGSVLWLLEVNAGMKANLREEAQRAGIAPERLVFAPIVHTVEHVARNAAADLFLDTLPYGAHTTANDALLAGLPVLTCVGETLVSRIAGSQLVAIGLPELVTTSLADYEALALRLARDPGELARVRARLEANRWTTPLFDMAAYTREMEDGFLRIFEEHVRGVAGPGRSGAS